MPAADIRALREQVVDMLFESDRGTLGRLASSSKVLPVALVAAIGERAFGPVLSGRIAGLLDPDRAVDMAARLPVGFLAEIAISVDPRRASEVIARIPPEQIAAITRELTAREEYVTMGRFVGQLPDPSVTAALAALDDPALLRVAFVLEDKNRLSHLTSLLPDDRLDGIIDAAARENLWPEALDLLDNLSQGQQVDFAGRTAKHDDAVLDSLLLAAARDEGLSRQLEPLHQALTPEARARYLTRVQALDVDAATRERLSAGLRV